MRVSSALARITHAATRRPVAVLLVVGALSLGGGALALGLEPSAGTDTLVGRNTGTAQATRLYHERFGEDAIVVLVRGSLTRLVLTPDLTRLIGLEGCLSGNAPRGARLPGGPRGPCAALARERPAKVVYGPGTFINEAVRQVDQQYGARTRSIQAEARRAATAARRLAIARGLGPAARRRLATAARQVVELRYVRELLRLGTAYPGVRPPFDLSNTRLVYSLVFDPARGFDVPKARFAYLFPNRGSALIQVRLRPGLTDAQRSRAIDAVRAAVRMPQWRLAKDASYTVSGVPVVVDDLAGTLTHAIVVLLLAALLVMAATLALVFRGRPRLLPLLLALAAAGLTFGAMALAGATLTIASIAVLPVLIGLAVDYAIQFHARHEEERRAGAADAGQAAVRAARAGGPTIVTAGLATAAGFLVLLLSPVPMVRGFGVLLVVGIALAFACALTAGFAALVLAGRPGGPVAALGRALAGRAGAGWRATRARVGATRALAGGAARARGALVAAARRTVAAAVARPERVLAIGLALAAVGWFADTRTEVVSDLQRLVPADLRGVRDATTLQRATGVAGELTVLVEAPDLTDPAVIGWMRRYQSRLLTRYRYSAAAGCGKVELCPALSLPDLFRGGALRDRSRIRALLDAVPAYFSQAVITRDRRVGSLAFGIRLMPLERQQRVIEDMRRRLDPPAGVRARLAGLPVLTAEAAARISSPWRRALTLLAGLLAVFSVLFAVYRRLDRALVPIVPIALATGWSALLIFLTRIPLNPMSASLGALVIAISTEFSVLLSARYREERDRGLDPAAALARTYRSTGAAVLASGATAIAGFAVLILSDIRMLRDFGFVTVIDLSVSLLGVMLVLPAVLVLAERGELPAAARRGLRRVRARLPGRARTA